jgi:hypothetical protein
MLVKSMLVPDVEATAVPLVIKDAAGLYWAILVPEELTVSLVAPALCKSIEPLVSAVWTKPALVDALSVFAIILYSSLMLYK